MKCDADLRKLNRTLRLHGVLLRLLGHESTPQNTHVFTLIILCLCFKRNIQIYEFSIRNVVAEQIVHGAFVKIAAPLCGR